jgi:hypothetical protein
LVLFITEKKHGHCFQAIKSHKYSQRQVVLAQKNNVMRTMSVS